VAVLATFSVPSEAEYYTVSFTGGNVHVTDSDPPCEEDSPYQTSGSTRSGAGITGVCGTPPGLPGAGTVDCTGTLTATFTFVPEWANEEPPKYAVVYELSEASYVGDSGDCASGLGHPVLPPFGYAKTSMGERWTLRANPGLSFPITVTPSASSVWVNGDCGETSGEASVSYTAGCYPVYVKLEGTLKVYSGSVPGQTSYAKHECMIGQQVVATLVCPSWPDNTRSWAVEGGNAFTDYQVAPPNGDSASLLPYSQGQTGQSTTAYFREPGAAKFQCTVFLGGPIQQQVTVKGDLLVRNPDNTEPDYQSGWPAVASYQGFPSLGLYDAPPPVSPDNNFTDPWWGVRWSARPSTPSSHQIGSSKGSWHWIQTLQTYRWFYRDGAWWPTVNNGLFGLDTTYPYEPAPYGSSGDPLSVPPGRYPCDGVWRTNGDAPFSRLSHPPYEGARVGASNFWVHLMYLPPARSGYGVRWVCLAGLNWIWLGESAYSHLTGEWSPAFNEYYTHDSMGEYPDQPEWGQILTAPPFP